MGEGLLGAILGGDEETREETSQETGAAVEAFAAAVAAKLAGTDPQVARDTSAYLQKQAKLLDTQNKYLEEEHALRMSHLRGASAEGKLRRLGTRLRISVQIFGAVAAGLIGIGVLVILRDAISSRSVVIDPFEVAPNIATEAPSGKIVAQGLLDVLTIIQAATRSGAEHRRLSNAWTNDIALEVPETGISIGELERTLRTRFGHDQHIAGELLRSAGGGWVLKVRGTGILPRSFTDEGGNLDKLLTEAGEYIYGQSQPGLWAAYLSNNGRNDEAIRFCEKMYSEADPAERPYLLNYWANALSATGGAEAMREALRLYQAALRLDPHYWAAYNNVMYALGSLGDEEGIVRTGRDMINAAGGRPGRAPETYYTNYDQALWDVPTLLAAEIADLESHAGIGTLASVSGAGSLNVAQAELQAHDPGAAELRIKTTFVDPKDTANAALMAIDRALLAEENQDFKAAAADWDLFVAAYADPAVSASYPNAICFAALTYERTGQPSKADAALDAVGKLTYVDCYRFRGDLLDRRGDWTGAQEWYAKTVQLAPDMPAGYYSWGVALAAHGDLGSAVAKLNEAHEKGPHWAEPLKAWGDVLLKQGDAKGARVKYDAALKYAPHWSALKKMRQIATGP